MKKLTRKGDKLVLVVPDAAPMRAAAGAVRAGRFLGRSDGCAVYEYPAEPDVAAALVSTFEPPLLPAELDILLQQHQALEGALRAKESVLFSADVDPGLATEPYQHQVQAFNFAWARWRAGAKGTGLLMEQGTGKTLVSIALANALHQAGLIDWTFVVCPSTLRGTWAEEIEKHSSRSLDEYLVLAGTRVGKADELAAYLADDHEPMRWAITNYEQFAVDVGARNAAGKSFRRVLEAAQVRPGLVIFDESTYLKNFRSKRTRACQALATAFPRRLIMTGTPITKSPLDAFAQFEVLDKGCLGFNTYLAFERAYATYRPQRIAGGRTIQVPDGYQNLEDLEGKLARVSYRARAADCLDLPPVVVKQIPVELTPRQVKVYRALTSDMMAELEGGALVDGRNILTRYGKLAQICGGFVNLIDQEGNPLGRELFDPNPKLEALIEYLDLLFEDPDAKAVVFCQYVAECEAVLGAGSAYGPVGMWGAIPVEDREAGRKALANDPGTRLMVCQYRCGSKGLNLTAANTLIFYSLTFDLEDYLQAQKRVHRAGQDAKHVNEVYLVANRRTRNGLRPTIDHLITRALREKKNLADVVTGDRAREVLEEAL